MSVIQQHPSDCRRFATSGADMWAPTDGEISFLWSFIQGSIAVPETWNALLRSFGFCERHAWMHIGIEMSFRDQYLLGPTILYTELIGKAVHAIDRPRFTAGYDFRTGDPCVFCTMNLRHANAGACPQVRLARGRDISNLRDFASRLRPLWSAYLCPDCSGQAGSPMRCRRHLLAAIEAGAPVDFRIERYVLDGLSDRMTRYQKSFLAEGPQVNDHDRAALIAAIGWCSGWRPLLVHLS
jgi:hypothetical protein